MSAKNQGYLMIVIGLVFAGIAVYSIINRGRPGPDIVLWAIPAVSLILSGLIELSPLGAWMRRRKRAQLKRFLESED